MSSKEIDSTPRYGIEVPLKLYERGDLGGFILQNNYYEDFFIKGSKISFFLEDLRNKLRMNKSTLVTILEKSQSNYFIILKNKGGVKLHVLLNLPNHPVIQEKLGDGGIGYVKNAVREVLTDLSSIIYRSAFTINFSLTNLVKRQIGGVDHVILPTNKYEVREARAGIKLWVNKYFKDNKIAPTGKQLDKVFPHFIDFERGYNRTWNDFLKECGVTPRHDWKYDWSDLKNIRMVENWVRAFHNKTGRSPTYDEVQAEFGSGFHGYWRKVLGKTYNEFLINLNLPLTYEIKYDWKDLSTLELVEDWAAEFFNNFGRVPSYIEAESRFSSGLFDLMRKMNTTWHDFLEKKAYPRPMKKQTDWSKPKNVKIVEDYIRNYFNQYNISPPQSLIYEEFGGFVSWLSKNKGISWNIFLKSLGLPPRFEALYDWSDPASIEMVRKWASAYYEKYGDSPSAKDLFREGFGVLLTKIKWNEFLEESGLPTHDFESNLLEGNLFDALGKESFGILNPEALFNYWIFHPDFEGDYIIPDVIIHEFEKFPINIEGKSIKMERGQRFDKIVDFKRSYGSIQPKNWTKYPRIAKKIKFYFLKGGSNIPPTEIQGCKISFHSKKELINELKMMENPSNKRKIDSLVRKIFALDKGITDLDEGQLSLDAF